MRTEINFNDGWMFAPSQQPLDAPDDVFEAVTLPHTNKIFPHHNFDNADYQFISTYRKRFMLPEARAGRRVFIDFDGAMLVSTVYVNGHQVGVNAGGYNPFSFDITDALHDAGENVLTVVLDSTERPDVPPFGYVVDYLTFGGIYRDVRLRMVEPLYIQNVFVRAADIMTDNIKLAFDVTLRNTSDAPVDCHWTIGFGRRHGKIVMYYDDTVQIPPGGEVVTSGTIEDSTLPIWSIEQPAMCDFTLTLSHIGQHDIIDHIRGPFGIRQIEFREDGGFYLNGERVDLIGLNRHQTYPYIGAAAPPRLQAQDADIIKHELGCNIVRTSHYPQSPHFLRRCDQIGLLVLEEIPGWQFIGDEDWQALSLRDVKSMIVRDRNHPSIILWGVRVNESWDNDDFYRKTNQLAHELDPTRPTTGIRFFQESSFLEDVFGFNDFSNGVQDPVNVPHIITEFNGHMFPTKTFDNEERRIEHARRHAAIQDQQLGKPNIAGAIGWCAFDYNTHKEFGSGDRICYHGVMDIFRMPKWAAYVYASQQDPKRKVVLQAATLWTMGDRSEGGNDPITVYSNVDEIDVWYGDEHLGRFSPDRDTYPHLPHPPFSVTGLGMMMMWGQSFGTLRIVGYLNGEAVAEQQISSDGVPRKLELSADFGELRSNGADMTPLKVRITDEFGNVLPYANIPVMFSVAGYAELVGENPLNPPGGQGAIYLKASTRPGDVTITARAGHLPPASVTVRLNP